MGENPYPESMFTTRLLDMENLTMINMGKTKYARRHHSLAQLKDKFIYCIGSAMSKDNAFERVEVYNVEIDL